MSRSEQIAVKIYTPIIKGRDNSKEGQCILTPPSDQTECLLTIAQIINSAIPYTAPPIIKSVCSEPTHYQRGSTK